MLDTLAHTPEENADKIIKYLVNQGLLLEDEDEAIIQENIERVKI